MGLSMENTIEVFCSCAPEDQKYLDELLNHLKSLERHHPVRIWKSSDIPPGVEWEAERNRHLNSAQVVLFLISAPFLASPFYEQEILQALSPLGQKKIAVFPILLRPVSLQQTFLEKLQYLPRNGKPIVQWASRDDAFFEVTDEIKRIIWSYFLENETMPERNPTSVVSRQPRMNAGQTAFDFMAVIVDPKLAQFHAREQYHKRAWNRLQIPTVGSVGITWLFAMSDILAWAFSASLLWQAILKILLGFSATTAIVCVLILLLSRSYSLRRWQYYQQRRTDLSNEKAMYETNRGIYAWISDPQRAFMERVSQIIQNVGDGTRSTDETKDYFSPDAQR
jgi:TIR domain